MAYIISGLWPLINDLLKLSKEIVIIVSVILFHGGGTANYLTGESVCLITMGILKLSVHFWVLNNKHMLLSNS